MSHYLTEAETSNFQNYVENYKKLDLELLNLIERTFNFNVNERPTWNNLEFNLNKIDLKLSKLIQDIKTESETYYKKVHPPDYQVLDVYMKKLKELYQKNLIKSNSNVRILAENKNEIENSDNINKNNNNNFDQNNNNFNKSSELKNKMNINQEPIIQKKQRINKNDINKKIGEDILKNIKIQRSKSFSDINKAGPLDNLIGNLDKSKLKKMRTMISASDRKIRDELGIFIANKMKMIKNNENIILI